MHSDLRWIQALMTHAAHRPFQDEAALQSQRDAFFGEAEARCSFDRGRLALSVNARTGQPNEYTLCCVRCGRRTPSFVVVEGIAVVVPSLLP